MTNARKAGLGGFICCVVGTEQYALAGADIRVVARAEYMKKDNRRGNRVGTLQQGAEALPVYSLAGLLGRRPDTSTADRYIIVTRGEGESFGLLVDRIVRTPQAGTPVLLPLPAAVGATASTWFDGLLRVGDLLSCLVVSSRGIDPLALARPRSAARPPVARAGRQAAATLSSGMVLTFTSAALPSVQATRYALGADRVGGIVQSLPSVPLPGAPAHVSALGWWRDNAVPVLHLNAGAGDADPSERFLVARSGEHGSGGFVAFRIDVDATLHRATAADRRQPAPARADSFTRGIFSIDGNAVALLDLDAVVAGPGAVPRDVREQVPAAV